MDGTIKPPARMRTRRVTEMELSKDHEHVTLWLARRVIRVINGYAIRRIPSRWGTSYCVVGTSRVFATFVQAEVFALGLPPGDAA